MASFLHASALLGADGVTAATFLPYARRVTDILQVSMQTLAADV